MKVSESRIERMEQAKRRKVEAMRRKMHADYPLAAERRESAGERVEAAPPLPRC